MFEWDEAKAAANLEKHGIDFRGVVDALLGLAVTTASPRDEMRMISVVEVRGRLVTVVWTPRAGAIRIISARRSRRSEERAYYQAVHRAASRRQDRQD